MFLLIVASQAFVSADRDVSDGLLVAGVGDFSVLSPRGKGCRESLLDLVMISLR